MEHNNVKSQLLRWLLRRSPSNSAREVADIPVAIASDIGNGRKENQDRVAVMKAQVSKTKSFVVAVLCDGMGGMSSGSSCAAIAVSSFLSSCVKYRNLPVHQRILNATFDANMDVYNSFHGNGGSTLTALIIENDGTVVGANLGDSRLYEVSEFGARLLSIDDTLAARLKNSENQDHRLLQFVGMGEDAQPSIIDITNFNNDSSFILTSDGIHYLEQKTFKSLLMQNISPIELCRRLVHVAKWCGGQDNLSAIVISHLSDLFNLDDYKYTGTVQIWDQFGELFLIGVEKVSENQKSSEPVNDSEASVSDAEENSGSDIQQKEKVKHRRRTRRVKKLKNEDESNEEKTDLVAKPQFKMDFENE